jgi:hypothetical protein
LGDPIVVDGELIVGVHRDAAGHVSDVQITTPSRNVTFSLTPDEKHPGLRYVHADLKLPDRPNFASADDIDGDGRIDRIMLTPPGEKRAHILLRIGAEFVQVQAIGGLKFKTADGRTFGFARQKHEWVSAH